MLKLEKNVKEKTISLSIKRKKYDLLLYQDEEDPSLILSCFRKEELPQPRIVIVMIIKTIIEEEVKDDLWRIDPQIQFLDYDNSTELVIPIETFWERNFLDYGKSEKWFKYKLKGVERRSKDQNRGMTFLDDLRKIIGIPTPDEWEERQHEKRTKKQK